MEENNNIQVEKQPISQKNNNSLVIILVLLVIALTGALIYVLVLKPKDENKPVDNSGSTPTTNVLSNDEALRIAKEKVEAANNFWGSFKSSSECSDSINGLCYFDTQSNFKNKFYNIYSKKIVYTDVYNVEIKDQENDDEAKEGRANIRFSNNKVYVWNQCTMNGGYCRWIGNYEIKNVVSDTILTKYVIACGDPESGLKEENIDQEAKLVKEDNEWRVAKVTIIGVCDGAYEIGK